MKTLKHSLCLLAVAAAAALPSPASAATEITNAPPRAVTLENFSLTANLSSNRASFTLKATAHVEPSKGGTLELFSGNVALTGFTPNPKWRLRTEDGSFVADFDRAGRYPLEITFDAAVKQGDGWKRLEFQAAPCTLRPILVRGLAETTQLQIEGAARPERKGEDYTSYLPPEGSVGIAWKDAPAQAEGKLFYAVEMLSQVSVSPGLLRQTALVDFKIMQGELTRLALLVRGGGEVTRVQGEDLLSWKIEPGAKPDERLIQVEMNRPQKSQFTLHVQLQNALGAFPLTAGILHLEPVGATRFAGAYRIVNDGAVKLEIVQSSGASQISPDQFPESDLTRSQLRPTGSQRFVYRFSGPDHALSLSADQTQPEITVSQLLLCRLGENELVIEGEIELDIREAPVRELLLRVPKGYLLARLTAAGVSDQSLTDKENDAELRLIYGEPVMQRQVIGLRLERNKPLAESTWSLPRVEVAQAKAVRGYIGVTSDPGYRLTPGRSAGVTEIATALFPQKIAGLQCAFRISEPAWQAAVKVDRLPQSVQADVLNLFSIAEGVAYGSTVVNYSISGAPLGAFKMEMPEEYSNVEFIGKDIRNWQKTSGGYLVQLHTPVAGAYTLLATYERPFKAHGETLGFTGARPLDAQPEQGHTLIISAYQFQVVSTEASPGLLPLEPGEIPAEYRLFFDAPILAAYRYTARPYTLKMALQPLPQGGSLSQVVDRATLSSKISRQGQVITDARYYLKNRGNPNLRLQLPAGTKLWSAAVNGAPAVPVTDAQGYLVPLPQRADPNAVLILDLKLASESKSPGTVQLATPVLGAPVLLAQWTLQPDTGQRLRYSKGSLEPAQPPQENIGFTAAWQTAKSSGHTDAATNLVLALALILGAFAAWSWASVKGVYRLSPRHLGGLVLGSLCLLTAFYCLVLLGSEFRPRDLALQGRDLVLLAPVQQTGNGVSVEVDNVEEGLSLGDIAQYTWPVVAALGLWIAAWRTVAPSSKVLCRIAGWMMLAWAALNCPGGLMPLIAVACAVLLFEFAVPVLRRLWAVPLAPVPAPPAGDVPASAAPTVSLLIGLLWIVSGAPGFAARPALPDVSPLAVPSSVIQELRIEDKFASGSVKIVWQAAKGEILRLLFEPAVLTQIRYSSNSLQLSRSALESRNAYQLKAKDKGTFDIQFRYELQVEKGAAQPGLVLPTPGGLVNRLTATLAGQDVDVLCAQAVSVDRALEETNTLAHLVLSPATDITLNWRPRTRDLRGEKQLFYAEFSQLYVPSAGMVEGIHFASIRPAQGELGELSFGVPPGATITDVQDVGAIKTNATNAARGCVSIWRFDPDSRKLRVVLNPPQSRPFTLLVRSQTATGPLPLQQEVSPLTVDLAAGQVGFIGVATGPEVQLDTFTGEKVSPVNLEDFPSAPATASTTPGLTVRRAFRYADVSAKATLKASAVEPDVRVEAQDTVSLAEDRTVLASTAAVEITRAGLFRLSFILPPGYDVESITSPALSHWTELTLPAFGSPGSSPGDASNRVVTLHLSGKTQGSHNFHITLAGPGVRATNNWSVPQLVFREAAKYRGTLVLVPEQGFRLQVGSSEGVTQLDPQVAGIRQKGVLAFRALQAARSIALNIEQVEPWIQVTTLQHALVTEGQVKVTASLQYQIENTGLKNLYVLVSTNAENVRFQGEGIADSMAVPSGITNGLQLWEIKLQRRVIGSYALQAKYTSAFGDQTTVLALPGLKAGNVNLQRGHIAIQSGGRLQVQPESVPQALQASDWQSVPRTLQQSISGAAANFTYRVVEPEFVLPLKLERHDAAKLLPAKVNSVTLESVVSENGVMLTQARLEIVPGDKRLLHVRLPKGAQFWFAFVNRSGVWPWREKDEILLPLDPVPGAGKPLPVEVFYSMHLDKTSRSRLDVELAAPQFDLPLENITWCVALNGKWHVKQTSGSLQLQGEETRPVRLDVESYKKAEEGAQEERTKVAEELMEAGNDALKKGDPQQARRSFQAAFGLSTQDPAFNEDARVQLHNIKLQQALIGLNVRQGVSAGDAGSVAAKLRDSGRDQPAYTQKDAKDILERNNSEENAAMMRVAERLVQQQDAAIGTPAALRASLPEQERVLTFKRSVAVDNWADLRVRLSAIETRDISSLARALTVLAVGLVFGALAFAARGLRKSA